jgi:hypothetical protein
MTQPPIIPDYSHRTELAGPRHAVLQVFIGVLAGTAFSAVVWLPYWPAVDEHMRPFPDASRHGGWIGVVLYPSVVVATGKLAAAILLIVLTRRFRFVGIGLLISIALGSLIFIGGACAHQW